MFELLNSDRPVCLSWLAVYTTDVEVGQINSLISQSVVSILGFFFCFTHHDGLQLIATQQQTRGRRHSETPRGRPGFPRIRTNTDELNIRAASTPEFPPPPPSLSVRFSKSRRSIKQREDAQGPIYTEEWHRFQMEKNNNWQGHQLRQNRKCAARTEREAGDDDAGTRRRKDIKDRICPE